MEERRDKPKASVLRQLLTLAGGLLFTATTGGPSENPDVHFEHSDVNARGVVLTAAGILLVTWLCVGLLYFFFQYLSNIHKQAESVQAAATATKIQLPPEPRLQRSPQRDLHEYISTSEAALHSYQWSDRQKGTVSIPIDRAMDLIVQRGIQPQKTPPKLFYTPQQGSRLTGFEGKVEPEPR
jgi:hypothetical protein